MHNRKTNCWLLEPADVVEIGRVLEDCLIADDNRDR